MPVQRGNHNANLSTIQFYQGSIHPTNPNLALGGSQDNGTEVWKGPRLWTGLICSSAFSFARSGITPPREARCEKAHHQR